MDLFTSYNSRLIRTPLWRWSVFAQRAYMKFCALIKNERVFHTAYNFKMRGRIHDFIPKRIFFFGVWEPNLTHFMIGAIKRGTAAVDIGANIGYFTLLMSQLVTDAGLVISIEASPSNYRILKENIATNECKNVVPKNIAVADRSGEIELFQSKFGEHNTGMMTTIREKGGAEFSVVDCDTFMNIVGRYADQISFIKIDVEGAELPILVEIIKNKTRFRRPLIIVSEVADENIDVVDVFRTEGFECFFLENDYSFEGYMRAVSGGEMGWRPPIKLTDQRQLPPAADCIFVYS